MIEIDGVCRELERPIWESGDYISDKYEELIDLSTSPDRDRHVDRIALAIHMLNLNLTTTSLLLVDTELAQPYDDVIGQLNEINADIPDIGTLQPLITNNARFEGASDSFIVA